MGRALFAYLRRHHLALLALIVAMGGTAYAANRIGSRDIIDGSLKSRDFKDHAIRGRDVKANSLGGREIDESTLNDPAVVSATVLGRNGTYIAEDGFAGKVEHKSTGIYTLELDGTAKACSFGAAFTGLTPDQTANAGSISVVYAPNGQGPVTVVIRDTAGDLADLGGNPAPAGFSLLGTC